jgi:hypothetical protein
MQMNTHAKTERIQDQMKGLPDRPGKEKERLNPPCELERLHMGKPRAASSTSPGNQKPRASGIGIGLP